MPDREALERVLEDAGERWIKLKAAGKDTTPVDHEVARATAELEKLEQQEVQHA